MTTSYDDQVTLNDIDADELDAQVQINFVAPKNILNRNEFYVNGEKREYKFTGDPDGNMFIVVKYLIEDKVLSDLKIEFDKDKLQNQNRLCLISPTK